jgi:SPX domain protein involved in polyphosphate accumulation
MERTMRTIWLGKVAALAGLALFAASAIAQSQKDGEDQWQFKQIKLTEKQVQDFISAQKQLAPLANKLENAADKPDPALQKQIEQIAKSNGFSTIDEFDDVAANISLVLAGLDPQSGQFTEPPDQIKKDIDELKQDKQLPQKDKDQALAEMQEALKRVAPLQFKENVAVVKKYQKELDRVTPQEAEKQEPGKK